VHRLLFDNNISHRILPKISDLFPDSAHVMLESLDEASDLDVWKFARDNALTIVTKDSDFNDLVAFRGTPPRVIWLRLGNCRVVDIEQTLRSNSTVIRDFFDDPDGGILEI
jgi:predicted nuclease of predicted toxin-antitoxin system